MPNEFDAALSHFKPDPKALEAARKKQAISESHYAEGYNQGLKVKRQAEIEAAKAQAEQEAIAKEQTRLDKAKAQAERKQQLAEQETAFVRSGRPFTTLATGELIPTHTDEQWKTLQTEKAQKKEQAAQGKYDAAWRKQEAVRISQDQDKLKSGIDDFKAAENLSSQAVQAKAGHIAALKQTVDAAENDQLSPAKRAQITDDPHYQAWIAKQAPEVRSNPMHLADYLNENLTAARDEKVMLEDNERTLRIAKTNRELQIKPDLDKLDAQRTALPVTAAPALPKGAGATLNTDLPRQRAAASTDPDRSDFVLRDYITQLREKGDFKRADALQKRLTNPTAFEAEQRAFREKATPEELNAAITTGQQQIQQGLEQSNKEYAALTAERQAYHARLAKATERNTALLAQPYSDADVITVVDNNTGAEQRWHKAAATEFNGALTGLQEWEKTNQPKIDLLDLDRQQLVLDAKNLDRHQAQREFLKREADRDQDAKFATEMDSMRQNPLTAGAADEITALRDDTRKRGRELAAKYDPRPQIQALKDEIEPRMQQAAAIVDPAQRAKAIEQLKTEQQTRLEAIKQAANSTEHQAARLALETEGKAKHEAIKKGIEAKALAAADIYNTWAKDPKGNILNVTDWVNDTDFTPRLKQEAEKRGLTEKEARYALDYARKADWSHPLVGPASKGDNTRTVKDGIGSGLRGLIYGTEPAEASRNLPDGTLSINPELWLEKAAYEKAVASSVTSKEAKAKASEQFKKLNELAANNIVGQLEKEVALPGLPDFNNWRKAKLEASTNYARTSLGKQALDYLAEMRARPEGAQWADSLMRNLAKGAVDLGAMVYGNALLVSGSKTMGEWASNSINLGEGLLAAADQKTELGKGAGLGAIAFRAGNLTAQLMPQMAPMIIGGGLLAGTGKIGAMAAASLMGGLQTSGLQQASVYTKLKETINPATGQPYTHNEAWLKAAPGAIASGIVTGILTSLGGHLGGEAALATLLTRAGREAQRAAIKTAYNGVWNTLKTITGHAAGEIAEEVPDELFSQISEEISLKGNKADLPGVIENFIKSSPELILAVGAMGAGGGTFGDLAQRSQLTDGVRAEDVAAASAQIEGYKPKQDEGTVDPVEIQNRKSRAAIALAVAQGLDLSTLDETTLNAAGWTRKDKDGRTRADGTLTKLKDYAGPNVLDIDTAGKIKLDATYVGNLEKNLSGVHAMIGKQHLNWHTPASIEPTTSAPAAAKDGTSPTAQVPTASAASGTPASAAGKPAPISPAAAPAASASSPGGAGAAPTATAPARGVSAQGAAPATAQDAGGSPQVAAPAVSGAAADSREALLPHFPDIKDPADPRVQRAWEIANHLEMAGLDRDSANLIAAGEIRARGVAAGGVNGQVTSVPFNEMLSDLGVTGDRTTREGSEPLKLPTDGLAKLRGRQAVKIKVKTTGALGHPDLAQHTTPGHRAQEQMLEARGVKVHTVETEADAEKLIGAPLKSKGHRGVTVLIDGKPTVIFIAENFRNKPADGGTVIDHEFHHAAALLVLKQKPELIAKAQSEAAYLPNGESIYSGWKSLTPMGKLIEAAAAYAAGTWNPDQSSAIRQLVDAIIDAIAKAFGLSTTEASAISADTIRQLADEASAILGQETASQKPAKKGNPVAPNNVAYPALRAKIVAKEISIIEAVREAARLSGQHDTGELQDILTDHLGVKKLSAAAAVEALRANGELTGNKEDIPLAAGAKASQRTPKFKERDRYQAAPHFQPQPTDKATTSHEFGRARIAAIAALPPRARRWGTRYLNALEGILEQNHGIFEAFMVGPNAKRLLNGQQAAVSRVQGRVTLLLDLPKLMAQMSDLGDPRRRAAQTINEETWHAAQLHLESTQPGKWNKASLAAQWAALPVKLQRTVYTAYHNANPKASKTMPKTWTPEAARAMHSEFLRMLGQGLIDPSDITESVDVSPGLIRSIRDLLADLYNTLRQLIKGLPASQATSLDQQVAELRAVRDAMLQSGPSDGRGIAGKVFLQDPVMHAQQALESGAVFDQLAATDAIFKPEGLRRVWDLMTPEVQAKVLALKQTAPDFLKSKRTDKADLTRDLLTLLMDPRAASAMAQLNLAPDQPAAKTGTSMIRRALRAMGNYFRTPASKDQYAALVAKLDLHSATVLGAMRGLILRSQAEFSAAAMVQALPILTPKTNADDKEPASESTTVWKSAQQSAQAMVAAWMQEAQRQAFLNAVLTEQEAAANHALPGVADAVMRQSLVRQMAGLTWDSLKARMEANMQPPLIMGGEQPNQQAPRPLALPSPAQRSAQAIEEALRDQENERQWNSSPAARDAIARKLAQEEWAAAILHTAGLSERRAFARNGAGFDELRAIEAMIRVASGELTLSRQSERRTLSTNPETGAPVRIIGVTKEADLAALGITIEPDGTAHADVNAPVYIENGRIIIKQSTMDALAETLPITRQQIRMSEAETRAKYGMQPNAAPVTVDTIAAANADRAAAITERRMRNRLEELENAESGNDVGPLVDPATDEDGRLQGSADLITWLGREGWSLGWPTEKSGGEWDWFTELLSQYYSDTAGRRTRQRRTKDKDGNVVVKQVSMPTATKLGVTQSAKTAAQQGDLSTNAALVEWLILQGVVTPPDLHSTTRDTNLAPHQPGGGGIDEVDNAAQEANYDIPDGIGNAVIAAIEAREAARHNRANNPETGAELQTLRFSRDTNRGPVAVSVGELAQLAADGPATVVLRDPDGEETSMQVSEPQWKPMDPDTREMEDYLDHSPWFRGREQGNPERMVVTFSGDTKYGSQTLGAEAVIRVASEGHTSLGVNMDSDSESYIDDFADPDQTPTSDEETMVGDEDAAYQEEPAPDYGTPEAEEDDTFGLTPEQLAEIDAILNADDGDSTPTMGASDRNWSPAKLREEVMRVNLPESRMRGSRAWLTPAATWINVAAHDEAFPNNMPAWGYQQMFRAGFVRVSYVRKSGGEPGKDFAIAAEFHLEKLTQAQKRELNNTAIERSAQLVLDPQKPINLGSSARHNFTPELIEEARREMKTNADDPDYKGGNAWMTPDGRFINLGGGSHYEASGIVYDHGYGPAMAAGYVRITMEGDQMFAEFFGPLSRRIQRQVRDGAIEQQINPDNVNFEPFSEQHYGSSKYDEETGDLLPAADRFYSQLERTVQAKLPNKATGQVLRAILENPQNRIKAEELKWSGILAWADSQPQPLTKQQALDFLATEGSVRFEETRLSGDNTRDIRRSIEHAINVNPLVRRAMDDEGMSQLDAANLPAKLLDGRQKVSDLPQSLQRWAKDLLADHKRLAELGENQLPTRNTQHTLPGGTNDREVVVTWKQDKTAQDWDYLTQTAGSTDPAVLALREKAKERIDKNAKQTPNSDSDKIHYGDLDALAWFRANDRDNGQGLLVDEFQSKWHQLGREKGYKGDKPAILEEGGKFGIAGYNRWYSTRAEAEAFSKESNVAIPDAPYRSAWPLMLFKRALADAVAEGKQWIGWTTGDTQADRYDLSKQIDTINVRSAGPDTYEVTATNEGKRVIHERDLTADKLAETIGKELAKKAIERLANGGIDPAQQNRYEQDWQKLSAAREKLLKAEKDEIGHNKFSVRQAANGLWEAYYTQDAIAANGANAPANPAWQGLGNTIAGGYSSERRALLGIPDYMAGGFNRTSSGPLQEALTQYQTAYNILWRNHDENGIAPDVMAEWATFTGLDLKVGGDGMRKFYDDMLVKEFGKYVKPWGGKVTQSEVDSSTSLAAPTFQPISDSDWETFAGAEEFANGDRPLFTETTINVDGQPATVAVIIDANGLQMVSSDGETNWMAPNDVFPGRTTWNSADLAAISVETAWKNEASKFWKELQPIVGEGTATPRRGTTPIWRIDINDAMRDTVATGQALFSSDRLLASSQRRNEALAIARTAVKARLTFDQFRQVLRKRAPADKWNEYTPYLAEVWQEAQRPATPKTPAQPIGPAPKFDNDEWALGLGESPVPDPYMDPPGRRSAEPAKRAETPATAPANQPPAQSAETPAAAPTAAPQTVEEFFRVIAANPNWTQSEETTGFKETPKLKRYGALAGKYLRSDLVLDVRDIAENTPLSPDTYSHFLSTWPQVKEKVIHNYGANAEQRLQAIDESFGPLDPSVQVMQTKNSKGDTVPHIMRGRGVMVKLDGVPHVAMRQVALPSIGAGLDQGVRFLPLAGDKSRWTGHINRAIAKAFPNLDAETDVYIEPYGGGLVYLQNLHILLNTKKQIIIASSIEYEPARNLLYMALKKGDPATMEDIRFTLAAVDKHKPKTAAGRAAQELLWGNKEDEEGVVIEPKKASLEALKQVDKLAKLLQRPNVLIVPWSDQQTFDEAAQHAKSGQRVTLLEDSNYADLPGEETEDQYAKIADHPELIGLFSDKPKAEYIGKDPAKLLKQKLPVYRSVLGANGTIIATNNMNPILINGLLAEFGDQGHWLGYAHPTRPVPDGWMRHPDNKGVLWSTERPEYLAILRKGVDSKTPKYGYSTDNGLHLRNGQRRNAADLNREAQAYRTPSPHTGGSPDAAADALRRADAARSQGKLGSSNALRDGGNPVADTTDGNPRGRSGPQEVSGSEPKLKYPMTPLADDAKVPRLEIAEWQRQADARQAEEDAMIDAFDPSLNEQDFDQIGEDWDRRFNDPTDPLPAALRQAFPRVSPPTGQEVRQILSKPHATPLASAPRRARQSMEFQPPFHTNFGDILTYHWMSKGLEGTDMRVSDWDKSRTNAQTGRDIVHHFKVRRADGSIHTVSLESALGQLSDEQRSRLQKTIRSAQKQMAVTGQEALNLENSPQRTPTDNSRDLTIYRKLTEASTIKPLRPDQSQMLEQAERNLGQTFLGFAAKPVTPTLNLESEVTRTHDLTRTPTTEQLRLFASNRTPTSKPKQSSGFLAPKGVSWQHGESRIIQGLTKVNTDRGTTSGLVSLESEKPETYTSAGRSIRPYAERADVNDIFAEEARLIERAKAEGFFWDKLQVDQLRAYLGEKGGGTEHDVYLIKGQSPIVIRSTILDSYGYLGRSPAQYLKRLADYNTVFPGIQTRMIGVSRNARGNGVIWTAQPFVEAVELKDDKRLQSLMESKGWVRIDSSNDENIIYRHTPTGAIIQDAHTGNILVKGNDLYPIDVIVTNVGSLSAADRILAAAARTNTNPTDPQKDAENYETGKVTVHGLRLSIENPAGSTRKGTDANGKAWSIDMPHHYGRILGTTGADKDHVDFFLGPDHTSPTAFVINQKKPGNGHFDETKVMLGFTNAGAAARGYLDSYTKGWRGYSSIVPMTIPQLKHWLENGKMGEAVTKAPVVSNDTTALASSERQVWHSGSIQGAYDPTKADMDAAYGPGFYASTSKKRSEGYGKQPARLFTVTAQRWFDHDARIDRAEALRLANLLEVPEALDSLFADELESGTPIIGEDVWNALKEATSPLMANEALAQAGYDGATYTGNRGKDRDFIVWNADQITEIAPVSQSSPLPASARQPLPPSPDMDDYQTWGKDKDRRDSEWKRYRTDMAKWESTVAEFASKQGNLGTFLAPLKNYPSGQAYREARVITRVLGDTTRWRATIFGQQPITATSIPVGDWANNAWVPVAHNEFETKAEAYQSSANAMPEGYTFSTQPLFASNRTTLAASPRQVADQVSDNPRLKAWLNVPGKGNPDSLQTGYISGKHNANIAQRAKERGDIGLLITPLIPSYINHTSDYPFLAVDNGVFSKATPFSPENFKALVSKIASAANLRDKTLFVVAPDVVGDATATLQKFPTWAQWIHEKDLPVALAAQDGLEDMLELIPWKDIDVLFIGGSTEWKTGELSMQQRAKWAQLFMETQRHGIPIHMGRVNTNERIAGVAQLVGASTVDGTFLAFGPDKNLPKLEAMLDRLNVDGNDLGAQTFPELGRAPSIQELYDIALDENIREPDQLGAYEPAAKEVNAIRVSLGLPSMDGHRDQLELTLAASPRQVAGQVSRASFNHLDRKLHSALARMAERVTATDTVAAATQAIAAWYGKDAPTSNVVRSMKEFAQRELIPETVLPREIMSALHQMQIKQSMGQQQALDVGRALSGNPKFSDLAYPAEFVENPMHREQMFTAMEQGKVDTLPPALQTMAHQLRKLLVDAGREAVKQGRMSPDTFEGLRTNYMPRFTKDEAQASAGDWAKAFKLGVRDILAQRSTAWHITDTTRKDKHGLPVLIQHSGKKWRFDSAQARDAYYESLINRETIDGDMANTDWHWMSRSDSRTLRSITPDMLAAPATMTKEQRDIVQRVQRQLRNQFKKEAPYEPADLVKDPVYAVMRYLAQMTHDNATAEFFNLILTNPDWVSSTESKGFTQIPDNDRFGRLAGKWVKKEIADQVLEMAEAPNQFWQLYDSLLRLWKTGKTVLNPATHARNIIGNVPFSQFAGNNVLNPTNAPHYLKAFRVLRSGGDEYRHLYESGVLGADYASTELRAALETIVPVVQTEPDSASPIKHLIALGNRAAQWGKAHSLANVATLATIGGTAGLIAAGPLGAMVGAGVATAANSIYRGALFAYRMEDDLFKAAAFFKARSMGMTLAEAAEHVRTWFPYYDKPTSTTIKMAGRTALPFVSFFRESGRIFAKALKERPLSLAATIAIPTLITAVSQAMLGLDDRDEDDVKKTMRGKGAKLLGLTPLAGVPIFSMLIPVRTESGQLQQIDLSSTHPFADFMADRVENWHNDPWWQTWARSALSNPILGSVYSAATGRDPFGDRVLWDSTYTPEEKAKAIWGHAWKTAVPPLAPGGTNWTMIEQSTRRQANKTLAMRSPAQAVARGVAGIDARSADPDIYAKADAFRQSRGLPSSESNVAWPTDAAGRARKALFEELVQPAPDTAALTKILQNLNDLGKPVRTLPDVLKLLDARTPDAVINPKSLRVPFRASLAPEAKRVLTTALTEFAKARSNSGAAFAKARGAVQATTRAPTTP